MFLNQYEYIRILNKYQHHFYKTHSFLNRYKLPYTIVLLKLNKKYNKQLNKISIKDLIRITDDCIKVNSNTYILIFNITNNKKAYESLLKMEREILKLYNINDNLFYFNLYSPKLNEYKLTLNKEEDLYYFLSILKKLDNNLITFKDAYEEL